MIKSHPFTKMEQGFYQNRPKAILTELVNYYNKQLYSRSNCTKSQINDLDKYEIKAELPKLTENQKSICNAPITFEERKNALNQ